jgi:hypothetical protein
MKFRGLQAQFGDGCELFDMKGDRFEIAIANAMESLWRNAASVRPALLAAAERQIEAGQVAYDRLSKILGQVA